MDQEKNCIENVIHKLRREQFIAMERGFKLEEKKIFLVVALFGIGGYGLNINNPKDFSYLYYLIPLLAISFDALMALQKFSVRRIGIFLKLNSDDPMERKWEDFVNKHRDNFLRFGTDGFTILTFGASLWLIFKYGHGETFSSIRPFEYIWFGLLGGLSIYTRWRSIKQMDKLLDELVSNTVYD